MICLDYKQFLEADEWVKQESNLGSIDTLSSMGIATPTDAASTNLVDEDEEYIRQLEEEDEVLAAAAGFAMDIDDEDEGWTEVDVPVWRGASRRKRSTHEDDSTFKRVKLEEHFVTGAVFFFSLIFAPSAQFGLR